MNVGALIHMLKALPPETRLRATTPHESYRFWVTGIQTERDGTVLLRLKELVKADDPTPDPAHHPDARPEES